MTWSNKQQRLLAHDDVTYEWVDPADWRVSEVRLLDEVGLHGDPEAADQNLLIKGDALHALTALTSIAEYAERYVGRVRQVYIDPPFNTGQVFQNYDDAVEHSVWLTMLRDRLEQIHHLLADDGSVWVHLDDAEQHRARCVLDEVFGAANFVATFVWERTDIPAMQAGVTIKHDYIHVYRKTEAFNPRGKTSPGDIPAHYNKVDEEGRRYCRRTLRMTGAGSQREDRPTMWYPVTAPDGTEVWPIRSDGSEGRWRWGPDRYAEDSDKLEWVQKKDGSWEPYRRIYPEAIPERPPDTWLPYTEFGSNRIAKLELRALFPGTTPFATPKPERLIQHVIEAGSDEGDIVLDCFGGSGTTAAVAHKMRRKWVTVEQMAGNVQTFLRPRLLKVVEGVDDGGVTRDVAWKGGGGFTEVQVAPSMFEDIEGTVVLSDWATNGSLAEMVAAQLKFSHAPEGPFVGRKGRTRLAVLDGMLTCGVADLLLDQLEERENLVVVAMALEDGVAEHLRKRRPGSRARKVPRDLARSGKLPSRLVRLQRGQDGEGEA